MVSLVAALCVGVGCCRRGGIRRGGIRRSGTVFLSLTGKMGWLTITEVGSCCTRAATSSRVAQEPSLASLGKGYRCYYWNADEGVLITYPGLLKA